MRDHRGGGSGEKIKTIMEGEQCDVLLHEGDKWYWKVGLTISSRDFSVFKIDKNIKCMISYYRIECYPFH